MLEEHRGNNSRGVRKVSKELTFEIQRKRKESYTYWTIWNHGIQGCRTVTMKRKFGTP